MTTNNETIANTINTEELERRLRENQLESIDLETEFKTLMSEARHLMEQEKTTLDLEARSKLFSEIKGVNLELEANVEARTQLARTRAVIKTELGHRVFKVL